jgi:SNF2 family DNA or RNA helicase
MFLSLSDLADAMGLRKTVMTISLILANPGRGRMDLPKAAIPSQEDPNSLSGLQLCLQEESTNQIKDSKRSRSSAQHGGGTHIVCPMSLLGQWKVDFRQAIKVFLSHADLGLHVDHDCSCSFAEHWSLSAMRSKQRMVLQTRWV